MSLPTTLAQLRNPMYNGHEISRTSCDLMFGTLKVVGWTEFNHKYARTPGKSKGNRSKVQARTRGSTEFTASATVYETTWNVILAALAALGEPQGLGYSEVTIPVVLTMYEPTLWTGSKVIELVGAQITEGETSITDDDGQLVRKLTFDTMDILEDGRSPVKERGIPGF